MASIKTNIADEKLQSSIKAIEQILKMKDVQEIHKKQLLSLMLWKITERNSKWYPGFISEGAKKLKAAGITSNKGLNHEHVFTRDSLVQQLLKAPQDTERILKDAIGCIVTVEEHAKLNKVKGMSGWDRYKKAGIKFYKQ